MRVPLHPAHRRQKVIRSDTKGAEVLAKVQVLVPTGSSRIWPEPNLGWGYFLSLCSLFPPSPSPYPLDALRQQQTTRIRYVFSCRVGGQGRKGRDGGQRWDRHRQPPLPCWLDQPIVDPPGQSQQDRMLISLSLLPFLSALVLPSRCYSVDVVLDAFRNAWMGPFVPHLILPRPRSDSPGPSSRPSLSPTRV